MATPNSVATPVGPGTGTPFAAFGATPVAQPTGAAEAALTDSSGGTAAPTTGISANAQKETVLMPIAALAGLVNAQVRKIALPYAFQVTAALIRAGTPASTAAKLATLTVGINGTPVTGGIISATTAGLNTTGATQAATAITALNTGTAGQTLEVAVSAVTAFVEGDGQVEFTVINLDKANQTASIVAQTNAHRTALVATGLEKGSA